MANLNDQPLITTFENLANQLLSEQNALEVDIKNLELKCSELLGNTSKIYAGIVQCYNVIPMGKAFSEAAIYNMDTVLHKLNKELHYPLRSFELLPKMTYAAIQQSYTGIDEFTMKSQNDVIVEIKNIEKTIHEMEEQIKKEFEELKSQMFEFDEKLKDVENISNNLNICNHEIQKEKEQIIALLTKGKDDLSNKSFQSSTENYLLQIEQQYAEIFQKQ